MSDHPPSYHEAAGTSSTTTPNPDTKAPPKTQPSQPRYALISISWTDRLRLMRFPEPLTARMSETIQDCWPKGIQNVKTYHESIEFKLKGNPFAHGMDEEKIAIRKVILGILDTLAREGWGVHPGAGGLGRIGNYESLGEKGLIEAFGERIQSCNQDLVSGSFEVKFKGTLWSKTSGEGAVQSRLAILDVLQCLEDQGFALCSSLDLDHGSGGNLYKSSGETWFCCR
ncbi:hypothetical protein BBP40_001874 [Aspergillus hancockii]|nr:hypothetical protein BBP40_001874 [Aspergillus hancockii]